MAADSRASACPPSPAARRTSPTCRRAAPSHRAARSLSIPAGPRRPSLWRSASGISYAASAPPIPRRGWPPSALAAEHTGRSMRIRVINPNTTAAMTRDHRTRRARGCRCGHRDRRRHLADRSRLHRGLLRRGAVAAGTADRDPQGRGAGRRRARHRLLRRHRPRRGTPDRHRTRHRHRRGRLSRGDADRQPVHGGDDALALDPGTRAQSPQVRLRAPRARVRAAEVPVLALEDEASDARARIDAEIARALGRGSSRGDRARLRRHGQARARRFRPGTAAP